MIMIIIHDDTDGDPRVPSYHTTDLISSRGSANQKYVLRSGDFD